LIGINEALAIPCSNRWNPDISKQCLCPVLLLRSDEWATRNNNNGRRQKVRSDEWAARHNNDGRLQKVKSHPE